MRRQHFEWTFLVLALVLTIYGGYSLIYNQIHGKNLPILGLVFLVVGFILLITFLILLLISFIQNKKKVEPVEKPQLEETRIEEEPVEVKAEEPAPVVEKPSEPVREYTPRQETEYRPIRATRSFDGGSGYVNKVGYGPVLRVSEEEILDMRSNTYYRIEGNYVKRSGYGPVYEISGNRIRSAYGGYLYEISGGSVNKTYGGYYASISSGIIQTHDLSEKYELTDRFNLKQQLAVVAILFGE